MVHLVGWEIVYRLFGNTEEIIFSLRKDIHDTDVDERTEPDAAVESVTRSHAVVIRVLERSIFISDLSMRQHIELKLQFRISSLDRHILTETMVIHLFPYAYVAFVETGGGTGKRLFGIAPDRIIEFDTCEEITDAAGAWDTNACILPLDK